ncbi:MAG: phosphatidylglycerol lysyltransferase domain-containing protein [Helicobacteraceae bacterium]|nr:phosphatidylglycerol lysyltransferase domain-containing protein [Helicobacteraceae bacterium]
MQWKPIDIEDKELITSFFNSKHILVSDLTFTNLYLWHYARHISYIILNDCLVIKTQYPNENPFIFYPIHKENNKDSIKKTILGIMQQCRAKGLQFSIHSLSKSDKQELESLLPDTFDFIYREDRSDYIYSIPELIELKGKKYHKKKTHLNRFYERYPFVFELLDSSNAEELITTYQSWFGQISDNASDGLKNEFIGIIECLKEFKHLDFIGGILRVNGEIIAFSFGEKLNKDTIVIHIEKANINYQGAYQAINREFLANVWDKFLFVNREEDLGIEGLRKAKKSYQPLYLEEKFDGILKS